MNFLRKIKYQGWAISWTILIVILCCMKMPASSGTGIFFEGFDKLVHLGFFFVLTILLFYGKIQEQRNYNYRVLTIFTIILVTAGIGLAIELIQWKFFPYRSAEPWDFGCDMLGVFMAVFSYVVLHKTNHNEKKA